MKAIVCDKCGKVTLFEDDKPYCSPSGVYRLSGDGGFKDVLDLCEDCVGELMKAVREVKEGL